MKNSMLFVNGEITPLMFRLQKEEGWTKKQAAQAVVAYKEFISLCVINRKKTQIESMVPSKAIDAVWHNHILYMKDYEYFQKQLGVMIYHNPSDGSEESKVRLKNLHQQTINFRSMVFRRKPNQAWLTKSGDCDCSNCNDICDTEIEACYGQ
jgi:hypothetical protein